MIRNLTRIPLLTLLLLPIVALGAPPRVAPPVQWVDAESIVVLHPAIGNQATAEVGETLYRETVRTVSRRYQVELLGDANSQMDRGYVLSVKAGTRGSMMTRSSPRAPMACFKTKNTGVVGLFGDRNVEGCLVDTQGNQVFDRALFPGYDRTFNLAEPVPYKTEMREEVAEHTPKFHFDILYQGLSKGAVKISYREFLNNTARPAFDQDLSYELSPDGTGVIGFKGMRIKVLEATGHNIRYVIEQPMALRADAAL